LAQSSDTSRYKRKKKDERGDIGVARDEEFFCSFFGRVLILEVPSWSFLELSDWDEGERGEGK